VLAFREHEEAPGLGERRSVAGVRTDADGRFTLHGLDPDTPVRLDVYPEGRARVQGEVSSLLSLGTGFNVELTGRENVILNGLILGMSRRAMEARVEDILEFSGIRRFADQPLKFCPVIGPPA